MKLFKILSILAGLVLIGLLVVWFALDRYLGSDRFKEDVLQRTTAAVGLPVEVKTFHFSLWKGLQLQELSVGSPAGFRQNELLLAQSVDFRYRLLALLEGKVVIDKALLDHPKITLQQNAEGKTNLPVTVGTAPPSPPDSPPSPGRNSLTIDIREFSIRDGEIIGSKPNGATSFTVTGLNLISSIQLIADRVSIQGGLKTKTLSFTPLLLENLGSPFVLENKVLQLSDISASAFGGEIRGSGSLDSNVETLPLSLDLKGSGLQVTQLAEQLAGKKSPLGGKLELNTQLVTPLTNPMLVAGKGHLEVRDASLGENAILRLLGEILKVQELRGGKFDLAVADFTIANQVVNLSNMVLTGPLVHVRGSGTVGFDQKYDLQLVLNIKAGAASQIPREIRESFITNGDGSLSSPPFRIYGSGDNLQQTLLQELLQQRARSEIQKRGGDFLNKLFK